VWIEDFDKEIKKSNHNVLLILDGASSHVTDTGIIVSFKTHYRRMQLQHALDLDEAGKRDIYKIAWNEISANMIKNCWFHMKIISLRNEDGVLVVLSPPHPLIEDVEESLFVDPDDELAIMEL
ncbi:29296_t:CDS:2, partial [Racocetra persica]